MLFVFFCKQKTAYEMRISDWSSDVCSSDLAIVNSMIVAGEVDYLTKFDAIITGYATDAVLGPLYSTFQQNHDLDALIDALADIVENNGEFVSKTTDYWNTWYGGG